jgi:hypothetical protein
LIITSIIKAEHCSARGPDEIKRNPAVRITLYTNVLLKSIRFENSNENLINPPEIRSTKFVFAEFYEISLISPFQLKKNIA